MDNTQYSLTSPTASEYEQSDRQAEAIDIFNRCFLFHVVPLWTETQRETQKGSRGRYQVLSWNNKTEQGLGFQSLVVKRKDVLGVCPIIGFSRPGQRRRYQCFRYLSSDLQHPAVKRVLLL